MKRCLAVLEEETPGLNHRELASLIDVLRQRYAECAAQVSERFFTEGAEVFYQHVFLRYTAAETIDDVLPLRLVNRQFLGYVNHLRHVNLDHWYQVDRFLPRLRTRFPLVTSLRCHYLALSLANLKHLKADYLTSLELVPMLEGEWHFDDKRYEIHQLESLRVFKNPEGLLFIEGVTHLRNLTHLELNAIAMPSTEPDLSHLTALRHLWIRHFSPSLAVVASLPALQFLSSDRAAHFVNYTGEGELVVEYHDDWYQWDVEMRATHAYVPHHCEFLELRGHWHQGLFTGHAHYVYREDENQSECVTYSGAVVDNKRQGQGTEERDNSDQRHVTLYKGEWRDGRRHGHGTVYSYERDKGLLSVETVWAGEWAHGEVATKCVY